MHNDKLGICHNCGVALRSANRAWTRRGWVDVCDGCFWAPSGTIHARRTRERGPLILDEIRKASA